MTYVLQCYGAVSAVRTVHLYAAPSCSVLFRTYGTVMYRTGVQYILEWECEGSGMYLSTRGINGNRTSTPTRARWKRGNVHESGWIFAMTSTGVKGL